MQLQTVYYVAIKGKYNIGLQAPAASLQITQTEIAVSNSPLTWLDACYK